MTAFSALSTLDFLVVFAVGGYVIRFTAISTLAYCVLVLFRRSMTDHSWSLVPALLLLLLRIVVVVGRSRGSRTSVLLLSLVHIDDRDGNPRFDINLST